MKIEKWLFLGGIFFFAPVGIIYGLANDWKEPIGVVGLLLTAGLSLMIGVYFWVVQKQIDPRPEDDDFGKIETEAGELGEFAPQSWMPFVLAACGAVVFLGMATTWWIMLIGLVASLVATAGWVYEFYVGEHAH